MSLVLVVLTACGTAEPPAAEPADAAPAAEVTPAPAANALIVAGSITAPAGLPEAKAVFVSVKAKDGPPMPLAALRLPPGPFPLAFELTEAHRPMATGMPVPDVFEVKVTLDMDGNPMSPSDGDLSATADATKGARGIEIALKP